MQLGVPQSLEEKFEAVDVVYAEQDPELYSRM